MDNFARPPGADQGFAEELARAVTVGLINHSSLLGQRIPWTTRDTRSARPNAALRQRRVKRSGG
jgi:hypothetical protein